MISGKKIAWVALVAAMVLAVLAPKGSAKAAEGERREWLVPGLPTFSVSGEVDVLSKYVWRGMVRSDDMVVQPSGAVHLFGFSAGIWANADLANTDEQQWELTEVDYTLKYSISPLDIFEVKAGVVHYTSPASGADPTTEAFVGAGLLKPIKLGVTGYFDIDRVDGPYIQGHAGFSLPLGEPLPATEIALDVMATVAYAGTNYNQAFYAHDAGALSDAYVEARLPVKVLDGRLQFGPMVGYSRILDDALRENQPDADNTIYGVFLAFSL